jgi:CelD/BcsL family acetyltransferase involved in cellulose biosynthesis
MSDLCSGTAVRLIDNEAGLVGIEEDWRALAVSLGRPNALPRWVLAPCRDRGQLRVTALESASGRLVGILPMISLRRAWGVELQLLGATLAEGFGVMALPGLEAQLAAGARSVMEAREPALASIRLGAVLAEEGWVAHLARGRPQRRPIRGPHKMAPFIELDAPSASEWVAGKSKNFRRTLARAERHLESRAGVIRVIDDADELGPALNEFVRVHHLRWADRGGSRVLTADTEAAIRRAAPRLLEQKHLRLWTVSMDGETSASLLCLVAGSVLTTWLGGFDARAEDVNGSFLLRVAAVRDAYANGCRRVDLGTGSGTFKDRFASGERTVESAVIHESGWRGTAASAHTRVGMAAGRVKARVPGPVKNRLRGLLRMS